VSEEIDALHALVAPNLFQGFEPTRFPNTTLPALALTASAYRRSDQAGEAMSLALRNALFEEGRDIGDQAELADFARSFGLDLVDIDAERAVHEDWQEGVRRGVVGSPYFFVDDRGFFCPTLNIKHDGGRLHVEVDLDALHEFAAVVFGSLSSGR
jgi:2-hydroxychromene-2-carboxylate isomerase